ncbi:hypothetical protein PENSPDRAFT_654131 [Peniophora sp. CONT]|nr:hypothetical protein PENSPDRAFT_654131 [Peniophora sp. CONT]
MCHTSYIAEDLIGMSAVFVLILIALSAGMYDRMSSSSQAVPVPVNVPQQQGPPPPTFFAPPPGPPPGQGAFAPQTGFAAQAPFGNGAGGQFVPPTGPPPGQLANFNASGSSEAPPGYVQPPNGAPPPPPDKSRPVARGAELV